MRSGRMRRCGRRQIGDAHVRIPSNVHRGHVVAVCTASVRPSKKRPGIPAGPAVGVQYAAAWRYKLEKWCVKLVHRDGQGVLDKIIRVDDVVLLERWSIQSGCAGASASCVQRQRGRTISRVARVEYGIGHRSRSCQDAAFGLKA
jgi:hypothetical protein